MHVSKHDTQRQFLVVVNESLRATVLNIIPKDNITPKSPNVPIAQLCNDCLKDPQYTKLTETTTTTVMKCTATNGELFYSLARARYELSSKVTCDVKLNFKWLRMNT